MNGFFSADLAANATQVGSTVGELAGRWELLVGAVILVIGAFVVLYLLKNIIANAVLGVIALLFGHFILGINIPLNGLTILITLLGGLGGVAALFIAAFFGWL